MPFAWVSQLGGRSLAAHGSTVAAVFGTCALLWLILDLALPAGNRRQRGAAACLSLTALAFLVSRAGFRYEEPAAKVFILLGHLLALGYLARFGWNPCRHSGNTRWTARAAMAVLVLVTVLKVVHLDAWPPVLTDYAARTGVSALDIYEHGWNVEIWQAGFNDLQSGGTALLHLPVLWILYHITGPNPFSVRFAEVIGSTIALVFLWLWLSRALPGWWGVIAFALVSFSPEHLSQSRMGTYQSASLAVALALLWLAERVTRWPPARWYWWAGLGLAAGLIGYGYAPLRILYLFVASVLVSHIACHRREWRGWREPAVALIPLVVALLIETSGAHGAARMFQTPSALATDTPIWHKTHEDVVTRQLEPWPVVASHFFGNVAILFNWSYQEPRQQVLFGPACGFGVLFAVVSILRRWGWVAPLYYLLGLLPPLLIYPVMRRSFVMQPLVLVAAVLFFQGYLTDVERLIARRWWRWICRGIVGAGLACTALYGLHQFAADNGPVGIPPTFGTIYRQRLIDRLISLLPTHHIYVLNPFNTIEGFNMALYEPSRRLGKGQGYELAFVSPGSNPRRYLRPDEPICLAYLEEASRSWITGWLQENLPQCRLEQPRAEDTGQIMYTLYFCDPASPSPDPKRAVTPGGSASPLQG